MTTPASATRIGVILAVSDTVGMARFYENALGFTREVDYDDPPYVTLTSRGARLSLAEAGHPSGDLPAVEMTRAVNTERPAAMLVLETDDCEALLARALDNGATAVSEVYRPPWGGARCFVSDPEGNIIELEQFA